MIAYPLGLFDCCGVSDGAAAAIVTTPEIARSLGKADLIGWESFDALFDLKILRPDIRIIGSGFE